MTSSRAFYVAIVVALVASGVVAMVPLPKHFTYGSGEAIVSSSATFHTSSSSQLLQAALSRIHGQIFIFNATPNPSTYNLEVSVKSDDENLQFGVGTMQHPFSRSLTVLSYSHHIQYILSMIYHHLDILNHQILLNERLPSSF